MALHHLAGRSRGAGELPAHAARGAGTKLIVPLRCLLVALALAWASRAHAVTFGLEGFGGYNRHGMEVWNDDLVLANASGASFPPVDHTITYGLGARAWIGRTWLAQLEWEPFRLSSADPPTGRKLSFDTQTFRLDAVWFSPRSGRSRFGFGGGLGDYDLQGARFAQGKKNADLTGRAVGMQIEGLGEWPLSQVFAITAAAGCRRARIADTKVNGQSQPIETNYSGFMARLGLALYVGRSGHSLRAGSAPLPGPP